MTEVPATPTRLVDLRVKKVSGVDRAANLQIGWLVSKSMDTTTKEVGMPDVTPAATDPASSTPPAEAAPVGTFIAADANQIIKSLQDQVTSLSEKLVAATKKQATPLPDPEPTPDPAAVNKADLPADVRKMLDEAEEVKKANADLQERVKKMERQSQEAEFVTKARSLAHISSDAPTLGTLLLDISEAVPDATFKSLETLLKGLNAQMDAATVLTTQYGSPAASTTAGSAMEKIETLAKALVGSTPTLDTLPKAISHVITTNLELAAAYAAESR